MNALLLAYHHAGMGSWLAHTIVRGLIYRTIWEATRGLHLGALALITVIAVAMLAIYRRKS